MLTALLLSLALHASGALAGVVLRVADASEAVVAEAEAIRALHASSIVVDLHADVVWAVAARDRDFANDDGAWTIPRAREGMLDVQFFPLFVSPREENQPEVLKRYARVFREMVDGSGGALAIVRTSAAIRERAASGGLSAVLCMEGADGLGEDPAAVEPYVAMGLRYLGITWNRSNAFGEAALDPRTPGGLTEAGRELVRRCNDDGVLLDLAHASEATFWDVHRVSRSPLLVSHAGLDALNRHRRNIDDLQFLALARAGGVFGIVFHSGFLADLPEGEETAPLDVLLDHLEHARALGGVRALALGSDFDGGIHPPEGLATVSDLPVLTAALRGRGWTDDEIRGLLGENLLRLLDACDAAVEGDAPGREWPVEVACRADDPGKGTDGLTDRLVTPGPVFDPGDVIDVRWEAGRGERPSFLEVWGEPEFRIEVSWRMRGDTEPPVPTATAGDGEGNGRVEIPDGAVRAQVRFEERPARIDEIAVWAR